MEDKLLKAWSEGWEKASLRTKLMIIIETDILIDAFRGEATRDNCDTAHRMAVRLTDRIMDEVQKHV